MSACLYYWEGGGPQKHNRERNTGDSFIRHHGRRVLCVLPWTSQEQAGPSCGVTAVPQLDGPVEVLSGSIDILRAGQQLFCKSLLWC